MDKDKIVGALIVLALLAMMSVGVVILIWLRGQL